MKVTPPNISRFIASTPLDTRALKTYSEFTPARPPRAIFFVGARGGFLNSLRDGQ
jgi:hypothetical protein